MNRILGSADTDQRIVAPSDFSLTSNRGLKLILKENIKPLRCLTEKEIIHRLADIIAFMDAKREMKAKAMGPARSLHNPEIGTWHPGAQKKRP